MFRSGASPNCIPEDDEDGSSWTDCRSYLRRIFEACDVDGDGFVSAADLVRVWKEWRMEEFGEWSLEELRNELGLVTSTSRISYEDFLRVEAMSGKSPPAIAEEDPRALSSDNSLDRSVSHDSGFDGRRGVQDTMSQRTLEQPRMRQSFLRLNESRLSGVVSPQLKSDTAAETDDDERLNAVLREQQALSEAKLAQQATDYEERLTELHSVIAELTRKMENQRAHTIREELEEEDEEEDEEEEEEEDGGGNGENGVVEDRSRGGRIPDDEKALNRRENGSVQPAEAKSKGNRGVAMRSTNQQQAEDSNSSSDFSESDMLAMIVKPMESPRRIMTGVDRDDQESVVTQVLKRELRLLQEENERLRLRDRDREVEIARLSSTLDNLAASMPPSSRSHSHSQSQSRSSSTSASKDKSKAKSGDGSPCHENNKDADRRLETEKLRAKLDSARATNDLLTLQLKESRLTAENMFIALTKEESNCVALQMALENSRRAVCSYEALLALMDAELAVLFVNCRLAGVPVRNPTVSGHGSPAIGKDGSAKSLPDEEEASRMLNLAYDRRNVADTVARGLVRDLDAAAVAAGAGAKKKSSDEDLDWRLRAHTDLWKAETEKVARTVQSHKDAGFGAGGASSSASGPASRRRMNRPAGAGADPPAAGDHVEMDFEVAVLAQELYALKEEKAELESRLFVCNKERQALELQYGAGEAREAALKALVEALRAQMKAGDAGPDSAEPERRAKDENGQMRLALRVHELGIAVETLIQDSDHREKEARIFLDDLRKANKALIEAVDRSKSKNQMKSRRLEQEIAVMVERHAAEVQALNAKIHELQAHVAAQQERILHMPRRRYASTTTTSSSSSSQRSLVSPSAYGFAAAEMQGGRIRSKPARAGKRNETQL